MKYKVVIILIALLPLVAACQDGPAPPPTLPTTAAAAISPTPFPTFTPLPTPTPVPTWPILFRGAPCEVTDSECNVAPDTPIAYYTISSDGTGLKNVTEFPSGILPPEGSPRPYGEPQFSPDGSTLAYPAYEGLYVVDEAGEGQYLFRPDDVPGANPVGPVCWMPDVKTIKFVVRRWEDNHWRHAFYSMGLDDEHPQLLFTLDDLESFIWSGVCSPDGEEMAVTLNPYGQKADGVYLVELESGEWRQILTHYMIDRIRAPLPAWLRETTEALRESGKILFTGTPCSLRGPDCEPLPANPLYYYAINPDGSGLENVLAIPPRVVPPDSAPPIAFDGPVVPSPDGSMLAYAGRDGGYVVDVASGETRRVPAEDPWPTRIHSYRQAPICWTADGTMLELMHTFGPGGIWILPLKAETTEKERAFSFKEPLLDTILTWGCLLDGKEVAFSFSPKGGEHRGLYVMGLESGQRWPILEGYEVVSVGTWPSRPLYSFAPIAGDVWQIFFRGAPCAELVEECMASMGSPEYNYSMYSDGTGLQEVAEIPKSSQPSLPVPLPEGAPFPSCSPQPSPDSSLSTYYSNDHLRGLYVVDNTSQVRLLIDMNDIPGTSWLRPACWTSDGAAVRFCVQLQEEEKQQENVFYSINQNGENLRRLFVLTGLSDSIYGVTCSPDNGEMIFRLFEEGGELYLLGFETGEWRPILTGYGVYGTPVSGLVVESQR